MAALPSPKGLGFFCFSFVLQGAAVAKPVQLQREPSSLSRAPRPLQLEGTFYA